jgi:hypothetical protein
MGFSFLSASVMPTVMLLKLSVRAKAKDVCRCSVLSKIAFSK